MSNNTGLFGNIFLKNNNNNLSTGESIFSFASGTSDNKKSIFGNSPFLNSGNKKEGLFGLFDNKEESKPDSPFGFFYEKDNKENNLFGNGSGSGMNLFGNKGDKDEKTEDNFSNLFGKMNLNKNNNNNKKETDIFSSDNSKLLGNNLLFGNNNDNDNNNNNNNININISNINNVNINNVNINMENSGNNIRFNSEDNDIGNEEMDNEESKAKEEDKKEEEVKQVKISEELDKPDELDNIDNKDYARIINSKMKNYKKEMDSTLDKIEKKKDKLKAHEKLFNNFLDKINTSNKVINYIKDNLDNNTRQLERISDEQDKIINDLDFIEKNLDKKIGAQRSKEEIIKKNDEKNKELDDTFENIDKKIVGCHKNMKENNTVVEISEIKTLNQLLNRIIHRIKKDVQGKQIDYLDNIFKAEKKVLNK